MSIKSRLTQKTGDLASPSHVPSPTAGVVPAAAPGRQPQTGPGQMLAFNSYIKEADKKVQVLEAKLKDFSESNLVKMLDPKLVRPSKWANRHETSFTGAEFESLVSDVESAGGNVQPIKVRPVDGEEGVYEIVFGHRRHQACLRLGISVSAVIESIDDMALFAAMDRENRARADLSPFEQGEMYRRALDDGLFQSLRKLSESLGVDPGNVSKAVSIARLPPDVLATFESPNQIQYRWGAELQAAMQKDPDIVISRAKAIRQSAKKYSGQDVVDRLLGRVKAAKPVVVDLKKKDRTVGKLTRKEDGSVALTIAGGVLSASEFERLQAEVDALLSGSSCE
jgi:ParB family chromosome partitioning protein